MPFNFEAIIQTHGPGVAIALLFAFGVFLAWRQRVAERQLKAQSKAEGEDTQRTLTLAADAAREETRKQVSELYERLLEDAKKDVEAAGREREAIEKRLLVQGQSIENCSRRIADLERQIGERDATLAAKNAQIDDLQKDNAHLTERTTKLETKVQELQEDIDSLAAEQAFETELRKAFERALRQQGMDTDALKTIYDQVESEHRRKKGKS